VRGAASAVVAVAMLAGSAAAQLKPEVQTGSLIPVQPEVVAAQRAGQIRKSFARCVYARSGRLVDTLLAHSDPVTTDFPAAGMSAKTMTTKFAMETCLGNETNDETLAMRMNSQAIRSMLEEEAYLSAFKRPPSPPPARAPRVYVSEGEPLARARGLSEFSDCVMANDFVHADALLRTTPGSTQELLAARALGPTLGGCLTRGQTIKFTPAMIRVLVADGAWQMTRQPDGGAKTKQ
jgi:hypothetical protein